MDPNDILSIVLIIAIVGNTVLAVFYHRMRQKLVVIWRELEFERIRLKTWNDPHTPKPSHSPSEEDS